MGKRPAMAASIARVGMSHNADRFEGEGIALFHSVSDTTDRAAAAAAPMYMRERVLVVIVILIFRSKFVAYGVSKVRPNICCGFCHLPCSLRVWGELTRHFTTPGPYCGIARFHKLPTRGFFEVKLGLCPLSLDVS